MLTKTQLQEYIKAISGHRQAEELILHTGHGLLYHNKEVYMGLIGHKKNQCLFEDWNWKPDPDSNNKLLLHKHKSETEQENGGWHLIGTIHYTWEVKTIAPLKLHILNTSNAKATPETIMFFDQELTAPCETFQSYTPPPDFEAGISGGKVHLQYFPDLTQLDEQTVPMTQYYQKIWSACMWLYYLHCVNIETS